MKPNTSRAKQQKAKELTKGFRGVFGFLFGLSGIILAPSPRRYDAANAGCAPPVDATPARVARSARRWRSELKANLRQVGPLAGARLGQRLLRRGSIPSHETGVSQRGDGEHKRCPSMYCLPNEFASINSLSSRVNEAARRLRHTARQARRSPQRMQAGSGRVGRRPLAPAGFACSRVSNATVV